MSASAFPKKPQTPGFYTEKALTQLWRCRVWERSQAGQGELHPEPLLRWISPFDGRLITPKFGAGNVEIPAQPGGFCVPPATSSGKQAAAAAPRGSASSSPCPGV